MNEANKKTCWIVAICFISLVVLAIIASLVLYWFPSGGPGMGGFFKKSSKPAENIATETPLPTVVNLAQTLQQEEAYLQGYYVPLGDIKFVFPAAVAILSLILIFRTYGKYTKWLSIVILANSVGLLYLVNKQVLIEIIKNFI